MSKRTAGSTLSFDERKTIPTSSDVKDRNAFKMRGARGRVKVELRRVLRSIDDLDIDYEEDSFLDL